MTRAFVIHESIAYTIEAESVEDAEYIWETIRTPQVKHQGQTLYTETMSLIAIEPVEPVQ